MLLPKQAPWMDAYIQELVSFPNAKNDDQVDSTVFALAWSTPSGGARGWLKYYENLVGELNGNRMRKSIRVWVAPHTTHWQLITGQTVTIPANRIIEVTDERDLAAILRNKVSFVKQG